MPPQEIPIDLFSDPARATRNLLAVHETYIRSASLYPVEEFSRMFRNHLVASPDPDMALTNLARFAEATVSKASLFNDLVHYPVLMEVVMKVFGYSQYFSDILVRDPELFRWLTSSDSLVTARSRQDLQAEAARVLRMFQKPEKRLDALKRLYRREILRIGVRDILGEADIPKVTHELSTLADVLIDTSCLIAVQQLEERSMSLPRAAHAVIGLGKLGGNELNYSSDVDIIFVYEDEGETRKPGGGTMTHHQYFNKLAERVVQNLSQSSAEGHLYRVDTRLRPESGAGPLARSVESYLLYYEGRGELWERQMLIKGRPVAGDLEFGNRFLQQLAPFIYPRTFSRQPTAEIARIKARIEAANPGGENIKVRAGGIRDIEFIMQALQLVNGGKNREIRHGNTLEALSRLGAAGLLSEGEVSTLRDAYIFFRTLEHRLQAMLNTQTHTLPTDPKVQTSVARRVGLASAGELKDVSARHQRAVKQIFDSVVVPDQNRGETAFSVIMAGGVRSDAAAGLLRRYRFDDVHLALRNFSFLLSGSSLTEARDLDDRTREAFLGIAEDMVREISGTPYPDMTLQNLTAIVTGQRFPGQFYEQLAEPNFRRFILGVCSLSPRLAKGLAKYPLLLDALVTDPASRPSLRLPERGELSLIVRLKNQEETRSGIRNVLGIITLDELTNELSQIADAVVGEVLARQSGKSKLGNPAIAVFALGKYGTREVMFEADLDMIFVVESGSSSQREKLENLASGLVSALSVFHEEGRLYSVDVRLRPEGKSAPLVVDAATYAEYLSSRASLWERQALTRLRFVCGDADLGKRLEKQIASFVYEAPLPRGWTDSIVSMRRKMETRSRTHARDFLDLKLGPGGMVDIEFIAQMLQLRFGDKNEVLKSQSTAGVLAAAPERWLNQEDARYLKSAYVLLRELEKLMRITLEERGTVLPDGRKLDILARCYDKSSGDALKSRVASLMSRVRSRFLSLSQSLSQS